MFIAYMFVQKKTSNLKDSWLINYNTHNKIIISSQKMHKIN